MTDALDKLSDAELGEVFAVVVAGYSRIAGVEDEWNNFAWWFPDGNAGQRRGIPNYATSADAVMPHLEKCGSWDINWNASSKTHWAWICMPIVDSGAGRFNAHAPTFARAACIALILAKRAEKNLDHSNPTLHT